MTDEERAALHEMARPENQSSDAVRYRIARNECEIERHLGTAAWHEAKALELQDENEHMRAVLEARKEGAGT
jgi:hypothetical protein